MNTHQSLAALEQLVQQRLLILDGGMGTMVQSYRLTEEDFRGTRFAQHQKPLKGHNDLLVLTKPEVIQEIHLNYLRAGSDIIETNTFSANAISLEDYGMQELAYEMNVAAARLAKAAVTQYLAESGSARPVFVAGAIGPTNRTLSLSPDVARPEFRNVTFDQLFEAYCTQVRGLLDGGVDALLVETVFDTLNAKAALLACQSIMEERKLQLPLMVSVTIIDQSGRTLSGQTLEAFFSSVAHFPLFSLGINCALGADLMMPYVRELHRISPFYLSVYPNAGMPNQFGAYDHTADVMGQMVEKMMQEGLVHIVGGCCGTTDQHIARLATIAQKYAPKKIALSKDIELPLSGLEPLVVPKGQFLNIGERTNVTGSKKFRELIEKKQFEKALAVAREQVEGGANILDINLDDGMIDGKAAMQTFLHFIASEPDISKMPMMIDSSKWEILEAGLKCLQGRAVVNSISLKDGEEEFLKRARYVKQMGASVVVMAFDEQGQADNFERRKEICQRSYQLLTKEIHFAPSSIIFDPNILAIGTGLEEHANYGVDFLRSLTWIKENLPGAKTSGGLSNLSFAFRGNDIVRHGLNSVFLYHAIKAGLDMAIVNPSTIQIYDDVDPQLVKLAEAVIFNQHPESTQDLIEYAIQFQGKKQQQETSDQQKNLWRQEPVAKRLSHAIVHGTDEFVEDDALVALKELGTPLSVIEGPLMQGMGVVGDLFGSGKMFLPQVVKSARVMKKAVHVLTPYLKSSLKGEEHLMPKRKKILMATVKGDVHDIGKNIVGIVLQCNNYEVIDLGVMVPCDTILSEARKHKVNAIGLSGLITPSLEEMIYMATRLKQDGPDVPLLIGGATTSRIHTAVKIDPVLQNRVVHVSDASRAVTVVSRLLNDDPKVRQQFWDELKSDYEKQRQYHLDSELQHQSQLISLEEARRKGFKAHSVADYRATTPQWQDRYQVFHRIVLEELIPYIDWTPFFHTWRLQGTYPKIFEQPDYGQQAKELHQKALDWLERLKRRPPFAAKAVIGFYRAYSDEESVVLPGVKRRLDFLRQQKQMTSADQPHLSLSDFILDGAHQTSQGPDFIGLFAVTAGPAYDLLADERAKALDDFDSLLLKALGDRVAEAAAEYLHAKVRKEFWGYAPEEELSAEQLIRETYQGIRPAPGYAACPDHEEKIKIFQLLEAEKNIGLQLTESFSMTPGSSICGYYFSHPQSRYFNVGTLGPDQVEYAAQRKNRPETEV